MKVFFFIVFLFTFNFSAVSQIVDTCDYVDQNNSIGGLDCAMVSLAPFTADSYQWLNCDSLLAPIPGSTTGNYSGMTSISVALVINYLGCIDTSECAYVCSWGLGELVAHERKLIAIIDTMGRLTEEKPNVLLIYVYSDGTKEKVVRVE